VGTPSFLTVLAIPGVEAEAAIVVERINGPVLLLSGQGDQMWPSALMAARASDRLTAHQHPFPVEHHAYDGAGHLFRLPFLPETVTAARHRVSGVLSAFGGTPRGNARAADDAWSRTRAFLDQHLT